MIQQFKVKIYHDNDKQIIENKQKMYVIDKQFKENLFSRNI